MGASRRLGWATLIWGTLIAISLAALLFGLFARQGGLVPTGDERILSGDARPRAVVTETTSITHSDRLTIEHYITRTNVVTAQVNAAFISLTDTRTTSESDLVTAASQRTDSAFRLDEPPLGATTLEPGNTASGRLLGLWLPLSGLLLSVLGLVTNVLFELRRDTRERRDLARLARRRQLEIDKLALEIQLLRGDLDVQPFED